MISNLVSDILSLTVDSFDSAISFHHLVWYGLACPEVEFLNICHYVVYTSDGDEVTHISLSLIYRIHMNLVDVYH